MNPAVSLCAHLAADALTILPVAPDDVLEWHDGPIVAVVRCPACDGAGLIELLDWVQGGALRVYALAGIEPSAMALYRRNVERGSCDLARRERELEALVASAGAPERIVARQPSGAVLRSVAWPAGALAPSEPWQQRAARGTSSQWLEAVGLK